MPTIHIPHGCKRLVARSPFVKTIEALMIATLTLAVLICLAALVPVVWTFANNGASSVRTDELRPCAAIADDAARLPCFDEIARRPLPHPARGANPPAEVFGR